MNNPCRLFRLPLLIAVLAAGGCFSARPASAQLDAADAAEADLAAPLDPEAVVDEAGDESIAAPPAMLRMQRVQPLAGQALERAALPLEQVIERLEQPDYLKVAETLAASDAAGADPEPEAVKAYIAARVAYRNNDLTEAMNRLRDAAEADGRMAATYLLLGRIYAEIGDKQKAAAAYAEAAKRDATNPDTLFRLGQLAFERGDWPEAAVALAVVSRTDRDVDPGVGFMADYFLGQALLRIGYDAAAIDPLVEFLREPEQFSRSTRYMRQVRLLSRQQRSAGVQLGDALMRLGRFDEAIARYTEAGESAEISPKLMAPRMVYAYVAADRFDDAEQYVVDLFSRDEHLPLAAELADYLVTVNPGSRGVRDALGAAYRQADRPEAVARAMAKLLTGPDRVAFLVDHLDHQPTHVSIYAQLVDELADDELPRLLTRTIELMRQSPARADRMMNLLLDREIDAAALEQAFDALPLAERVSAAGWYMRGMIARQHADAEAAEQAFSRALDRNPDFAPAQVASMRLMIAQGKTREVIELGQAYGPDAPAQIRHLIAVAMQRAGRHGEAIRNLARLIAEFPGNTDYLVSYATSQRAVGNYDEAEAKLARAIQLDPQLEAAYQQLFDIYEKDRPDVQKYRQLLARARQAIPNGRVTRLKTARLYAAVGDLAKAELLLRDVIADHPDQAEALDQLAALLGRNDRWGEMYELLGKLLDADPANLAALNTLRRVAGTTDELDRFYPRYETYLKSRPSNRRMTERLADLYVQWGRTDEALAAYDRLIAEAGEDGSAAAGYQVGAAGVLQQADRTDEAVARMNRAIALADESRQPVYKVIKASMLARADRADEAVAVMNRAIADHPEQVETLRVELARMLAAADRLDEAIAEIDKLIAAQPGRAVELYYMQSTLMHGREDATELYEKILLRALEINPNYAPANNDLGYSWADEGRNLAKAEQMIRKALAVEPDSAAYLDSMGWVLYKRGRFDEAIDWLNKARRADGGDDPIIHDHLGDALWQAGRTDEAVAIWQATLRELAQQGDDLAEVYQSLLPALREKIQAAEAGDSVPVAAVPDVPAEDRSPALPIPRMQ